MKMYVRFMVMFFGVRKKGYGVAFVYKDGVKLHQYGFVVDCETFWVANIKIFKKILEKIKKVNDENTKSIKFASPNKMIINYLNDLDYIASKDFKKSKNKPIKYKEDWKKIWVLLNDLNCEYNFKSDHGIEQYDNQMAEMLSDLVEENEGFSMIGMS